MSTENKKPNLPAIVKDLGLSVKMDSLNTLLNSNPPSSWMKEHKGLKYQPIERVKNNLVTIFQDYDWSIKSVSIMANSVLVYGESLYQDNENEIQLLRKSDLSVNGILTNQRVKQVAKCYFDAVMDYYK
jgi:hypothetical protein